VCALDKDKLLLNSILIAAIAGYVFVGYQIIRILLGGSWTGENTMTALITMNVAISVGLVIGLAKANADFHKSLAHLGASIRKDTSDIRIKVGGLNNRLTNIERTVSDIKSALFYKRQRG